jgi:hypothetical protein
MAIHTSLADIAVLAVVAEDAGLQVPMIEPAHASKRATSIDAADLDGDQRDNRR